MDYIYLGLLACIAFYLHKITGLLVTLKDRSYVIQNEIRDAGNKKVAWYPPTTPPKDTRKEPPRK